MTSEHLHLALNHFPIIGIACAIFPILVGIIFKSKSTLVVGLVIAAVCGWTTLLVMSTGEEASERYEEGVIRPFLDANVGAVLETHEERAETWSKAIYAAAALATIGLGLTLWKFEFGRMASVVVALACMCAVGAAVWIADSGGKIRRVDFRDTAQAGQTSPAANASPAKKIDKDD
jgi:peptidoglycan/LPS O-acetylase OafA/YrhL